VPKIVSHHETGGACFSLRRATSASINPAIIDLAFLSLEPLKAFYPVLQL
jgi:hypothetical protein